MSTQAIGRPRRRIEDRALLTGVSRFMSEVVRERPDSLHVAFARSPFASARLGGLDFGAARAAPEVVAVVTAADVAGLGPMPAPGPPFLPGFPAAPFFPVLPAETVSFVGQPVAAVVATSAAEARDAVDLLEIEYEPLPAVADAEAALAAGAAQVHAGFPGNVLSQRRHVAGDPDGAFTAADRILRLRLRHGRVASVAMEPRGILAEIDPASRRLNVWLSTQAPFLARADLASVLGMPEADIRVRAPDVGGGFGAKGLMHVEETLVAHLAREFGRPMVPCGQVPCGWTSTAGIQWRS